MGMGCAQGQQMTHPMCLRHSILCRGEPVAGAMEKITFFCEVGGSCAKSVLGGSSCHAFSENLHLTHTSAESLKTLLLALCVM